MEELIRREYGSFLSEDEIQLALTFYRYTKNQIKTVVICDDMKRAFYGKTFGSRDSTALIHINEEIAKTVCIKLTGRSEQYFLELPDDIQDEAIEIYESENDENVMSDRLCRLFDIKPVITKKNPPVFNVPENDEKPEKMSLLAKLKMYQDKVNKNRRGNTQ